MLIFILKIIFEFLQLNQGPFQDDSKPTFLELFPLLQSTVHAVGKWHIMFLAHIFSWLYNLIFPVLPSVLMISWKWSSAISYRSAHITFPKFLWIWDISLRVEILLLITDTMNLYLFNAQVNESCHFFLINDSSVASWE